MPDSCFSSAFLSANAWLMFFIFPGQCRTGRQIFHCCVACWFSDRLQELLLGCWWIHRFRRASHWARAKLITSLIEFCRVTVSATVRLFSKSYQRQHDEERAPSVSESTMNDAQCSWVFLSFPGFFVFLSKTMDLLSKTTNLFSKTDVY